MELYRDMPSKANIHSPPGHSWYSGWGSRDRSDSNWLFKNFRLDFLWSAAYENCGLWIGFEGFRIGKGVPLGRSQREWEGIYLRKSE